MTPEQRALRARIAVNTMWSKTKDRTARTATARAASPGSLDYWERRVDPNGEMDEATRIKAAVNARKAHFQRMAYRSAQTRARKNAS